MKIQEAQRVSRLVRPAEVSARTGLSKATIGRLEREGRFPARRRIASRAVAWLEQDIERWLTARELAREAARPTPGTP